LSARTTEKLTEIPRLFSWIWGGDPWIANGNKGKRGKRGKGSRGREGRVKKHVAILGSDSSLAYIDLNNVACQ